MEAAREFLRGAVVEQPRDERRDLIDEVAAAAPQRYHPALRVGFTGDVMSDLNGKRAKVHGMNPEEGGMTAIDAEAPLAEVLRYATDLRSITQGRGSFEMHFHHYDEVPGHLASKVIAEAQKAQPVHA